MKKINFKSKKAKLLTASVIVILAAGIATSIAAYSRVDESVETSTPSTTVSQTTTKANAVSKTTQPSTAKPENETTTKQQNNIKSSGSSTETTTAEKAKTQKSTTKKSAAARTTTKKSTTQPSTTKATGYAMTATEIRNYALEQIAKIDKTVYVPEFTKDNAGWSDPLEIYYEDSKSDIKRNIIDCAEATYGRDNVNIKWYNVYVEESTDWSATISSDGELKEYYTPCIKVYFLCAFR